MYNSYLETIKGCYDKQDMVCIEFYDTKSDISISSILGYVSRFDDYSVTFMGFQIVNDDEMAITYYDLSYECIDKIIFPYSVKSEYRQKVNNLYKNNKHNNKGYIPSNDNGQNITEIAISDIDIDDDLIDIVLKKIEFFETDEMISYHLTRIIQIIFDKINDKIISLFKGKKSK